MNSTSRSSRLVRSAARSPALAMTGPEVARKLTPSSRATICASVVLPSPGGPDEQHMIERLAPRLGRRDEHAEILARLLLADEFAQSLRAQARLGHVFIAALRRHQFARHARHRSGPRVYLFGNRSAIGTTAARLAVRHDHPRLAIVVEDQFAAGAAGRHHRDGLILVARRRMAHRDDEIDAVVADIDHGAAKRHGFRAHRHAAEISVEIDAGKDFSRAGA